MTREDTVNDLKLLMQELEGKKREIDSQCKAVATTIQLLNGDLSEPETTAQQLLVEPDATETDGEEENAVPW